MTENKRFEIKPSAMYNNKYVIHDSEKEYTFPVLDSTLNYMFCKALNEQHEQIERLKENFRALDEVKCELADENEKLKQHNIELINKANSLNQAREMIKEHLE